MAKRENIVKALNLVDKLDELPDGDRQVLRKRTVEAALGDNAALGYMIISSYNHRNQEMINKIIHLVLQDDLETRRKGENNGN